MIYERASLGRVLAALKSCQPHGLTDGEPWLHDDFRWDCGFLQISISSAIDFPKTISHNSHSNEFIALSLNPSSISCGRSDCLISTIMLIFTVTINRFFFQL